MTLLFDYLRGTRGEAAGKASTSLLKSIAEKGKVRDPLIAGARRCMFTVRNSKRCSEQVHFVQQTFQQVVNVLAQVFLYHTPALRGALKRLLGERTNEIVGLQHMKLYVFDDDVIISG